jgi:predicted aconitase with swiveling domain
MSPDYSLRKFHLTFTFLLDRMKLVGTMPKGIIFTESTSKIALGCVVMRIPAVTELKEDPFTLIQSGDI